jgi:hypothetical protein
MSKTVCCNLLGELFSLKDVRNRENDGFQQEWNRHDHPRGLSPVGPGEPIWCETGIFMATYSL